MLNKEILFGIYAIGEVIQLLDDIKQNTAKARNDADVGSTAVVADELPEFHLYDCKMGVGRTGMYTRGTGKNSG